MAVENLGPVILT